MDEDFETLYPSGCEAGGGAVHRLWEKTALSGVDWFPGDGRYGRPGLFTANVTTTVVLALAGIFGSVMMTTRDQSNLSVIGPGGEFGPVPARTENLPVPLRGRMGLE